MLASGGELADDVVPGPGVGHVEGVLVQVARLPLGEHEDGLDGVELLAGVVPEVDGDVAGDVAAVAVDVGLADPVLERVGHVLAQLRMGVVEVDDVGPVPPGRGAELALPVAGVPLGMLGDEDVVPRGVIGHPVEDDLEAELVRGGDEVLEVVEGAEFGIDLEVVLHGVGAAERALAVLHADGVDGHHPEDFDAEVFEARELGFGGVEGSFGRERAGVDLVDGGVLAPVGMGEFDVGHGLITLEFVGSRFGRGFGFLGAACEQYKEARAGRRARRRFMGGLRAR